MASEMAELIGTTRNPIPNGAVAGAFVARGGGRIRYARWAATAERRIGTVCLFHGRTEFIEKYFETITDLRRRGFAVATMDWRGQGGSSRALKNPAKGHAETFAQFDGDIRQFMSEIVLPDCPPPYYCLAHSIGGHLVLRLAQTKVCWWDRMVLTAPKIELGGTQSQRSLACTVAQAAALFGFGHAFVPGGELIYGRMPPSKATPSPRTGSVMSVRGRFFAPPLTSRPDRQQSDGSRLFADPSRR